MRFLSPKERRWRTNAPREIGFPAGRDGTAPRQRYAALIERLDAHPEFLTMLSELRALPPQHTPRKSRKCCSTCSSSCAMRSPSCAWFSPSVGVVDFVELGLAARQVLRDDEGEFSELAADVAGRWPHLLVDEFQDTSRSQYELFTLMAGGWESAGRGSCFLVGDPMQSIYMFRQAEVELFERTRRHGLGEGTAAIKLTPLQLQTNFRSHAGLVNRLNQIFAAIFTSNAGLDDYQVTFAQSTAYDPAPRGSLGVKVWPFFHPLQSHPGAKTRSGRGRSPAGGQHHSGPLARGGGGSRARAEASFRIAVLVRARAHLHLIARRLRKADISFRAVEIEQLGDRQEVKDLTALTRSLLHPMDRIAWLTVLRAPWCGLTPEGSAYSRR